MGAQGDKPPHQNENLVEFRILGSMLFSLRNLKLLLHCIFRMSIVNFHLNSEVNMMHTPLIGNLFSLCF